METGCNFDMEEQKFALYESAKDSAIKRAMQRGLCEAILSGDADMARLIYDGAMNKVNGNLA